MKMTQKCKLLYYRYKVLLLVVAIIAVVFVISGCADGAASAPLPSGPIGRGC